MSHTQRRKSNRDYDNSKFNTRNPEIRKDFEFLDKRIRDVESHQINMSKMFIEYEHASLDASDIYSNFSTALKVLIIGLLVVMIMLSAVTIRFSAKIKKANERIEQLEAIIAVEDINNEQEIIG